MHHSSTTENLGVDAVTMWERPPDKWERVKPDPTLFVQTHFVAHEKYPDGIADMVGYWAEDRILGGVLLFDHSDTWSDETRPEPNAYIHPGRDKVTFRICQLLDEQQERLLDFIKADEGTQKADDRDGPLPILPTLENRVRIGQGDAIPVHQVYRDPWEREDLPDGAQYSASRGDCHRDELDYPEMGSFDELLERLNTASGRPSVG
jgi:hypothetical protein